MSKNCCLLVLGDIGLSPRMQYHAHSLATSEKYHVDFVGYTTTRSHSLLKSDRIKIHGIKSFPNLPRKLFLLYAPLKVLFLFLQLLYILIFKISKSDFLLIQNPPTIPTMLVAELFCLFTKTKLVIDWHNFGWSVLALHLGKKHLVVKISRWLEWLGSRKAHAHFCVSKAMKKELKENWGIGATVLYDQPPIIFKETPIEERHKLFLKLKNEFKPLNKMKKNENLQEEEKKKEKKEEKEDNKKENKEKEIEIEEEIETEKEIETDKETNSVAENETLFTIKNGNTIKLKEKRPVLLINSTSWTKDDNLDMLLESAKKLDQAISNPKIEENDYPDFYFVMTGKGPEKEQFQENVSKLTLQKVRIVTVWLEAEDYPRLLGSSDLGICLHGSTSGFDLPMKVVDMFGCNLPTCALHYNCIDELVQDKVNGRIFSDATELVQQLTEIFKNFPKENEQLLKWRENLQEKSKHRWDENWLQKAWPIFKF
ncbi:chitobiosyldiphosphodolichol beta-mannosyltransferase [Anaeramoeba flamelloides]|uniref:Beta-1,4-mannosyltransferase n=1 Tax=Anaeramoeba flamelloides TaxID=1746091 RepID=A0ABQ8XN17_9EUKA|nr:chitobiosyldiphosphodolichol beta-mannosyltransferase [Anaeramoeba flamelloides]